MATPPYNPYPTLPQPNPKPLVIPNQSPASPKPIATAVPKLKPTQFPPLATNPYTANSSGSQSLVDPSRNGIQANGTIAAPTKGVATPLSTPTTPYFVQPANPLNNEHGSTRSESNLDGSWWNTPTYRAPGAKPPKGFTAAEMKWVQDQADKEGTYVSPEKLAAEAARISQRKRANDVAQLPIITPAPTPRVPPIGEWGRKPTAPTAPMTLDQRISAELQRQAKGDTGAPETLKARLDAAAAARVNLQPGPSAAWKAEEAAMASRLQQEAAAKRAADAKVIDDNIAAHDKQMAAMAAMAKRAEEAQQYRDANKRQPTLLDYLFPPDPRNKKPYQR